MFSIHAFGASQATSTSLTNLAALSDPIAAVNGNFLYVPLLNNLIGAFAFGTTLTRLQLQSPSLLADVPYDVSPVNGALLPASPLSGDLKLESPVKLVTDEPLSALVVNTVNEDELAIILLADGPIAPVSGRILRVRATFTSSSTKLSWQNAALTLSNQLAEGSYNLVGARFEGAHLLAARFVFPGGATTVRPGVPATGNTSKIGDRRFRDGNMGVWGTFSNRVLPTVDGITDGTGETVTVIMDLIKTG